jgi:hypothetical protein
MTPDTMATGATIAAARAAAATLLAERGYTAEAAAVAAGDGDDFVEVRLAEALISILERRPQTAAAPRARRRIAGEEC